MSITNYSELLTAVANWINRGDLTDRIPEYIAFAEAKMNGRLRVRQMEASTTDTMSSSAITLPSDWMAFKSIWYTKNGQRIEILNIPVQEANRIDQGTTNPPRGYYITGSTVSFFPTADSDYTVGYIYYQQIPALTVSNTTNWLLTYAPDAYLYGTVLEAAAYIRDPKLQADAERAFYSVLGRIKTADRDVHSGSALRMRTY